MAGNQVRVVLTADDRVSGPLDRMRDKFDVLGKNKGFQAVAQGVGVGAGISAWNLVGKGINLVTDFLSDSAEAYQQEQDSVSRLGAALKASIPAWDGNTDAIEKVLTARMKLGFSDEDQRNSLAILVGATGDVTKALDIERTAMDLARLKRISLADASDALTKVEAGSYRALKSLGIVLKEGATQQDALNAVQRVAMGQASEYADTDLGKLEIAQIKVNEAQEKFGKGISHIQAELLPAAADAITEFANSMEHLGENTKRETDGISRAWDDSLGGAIHSLQHYFDSADEKTADGLQGLVRLWHKTPLADEMGRVVQKGVNAMADGLASGEFVVRDGAIVLTNPIVDETQNASRIAAKIADGLPDKIAKNLTSGYGEIKSASAALGEAMKNPIKAAAREKALTDILDGKGSAGKRLLAGLRSADPVVRQAAENLKNAVLEELAAIRNVALHITATMSLNKGNFKGGARAAGGPVTGGETYLVGEKGPELFTPGTSGGITPNSALGGAVVPSTIHVHLMLGRRGLREIADAVIDLGSYERGNPTFQPA